MYSTVQYSTVVQITRDIRSLTSPVIVIILSANLRQDSNLNRIHLRTSLSRYMNDITIVSELCENFQELSNQDSFASHWSVSCLHSQCVQYLTAAVRNFISKTSQMSGLVQSDNITAIFLLKSISILDFARCLYIEWMEAVNCLAVSCEAVLSKLKRNTSQCKTRKVSTGWNPIWILSLHFQSKLTQFGSIDFKCSNKFRYLSVDWKWLLKWLFFFYFSDTHFDIL